MLQGRSRCLIWYLYAPESAVSLFDLRQLIRVPKAASTAASAVARTLVGCSPPGPCCVWGEVPVGSCPARGLDCSHKVRSQNLLGAFVFSP